MCIRDSSYSASDSSPSSALDKVELYAKAPGDAGYSKVATNSTPSGSGSFAYTATAGDGTYSFYTLATDKAGNVEAAPATADTQTVLDTAQPASSATSAALSNSTALTVTYSAAAGPSGVKEVELWVKRPGDAGFSLAATDTTPASPSFAYSATAGDGAYNFYTRASDNAGNYEAAPATSDTLTALDTVKPSSSATSPALSNSTSIAVNYSAGDSSPSSALDKVELYAKAPGDAGYLSLIHI